MIWIWVNAIVAFLRKFFLPPEHLIPKLDPCATCVGCGHRNGKITAIQNPSTGNRLLIQHDCHVCKAQWWENPVYPNGASPNSATVLIATEAPKE